MNHQGAFGIVHEQEDPLVSLGFTPLEAEIYSHLLGEPGATGYRLAQRLKKPAPNVYKAIQSLEAKGAVMVVDGKHRHCSPVPPDELLARLERQFQASKKRAAKSLAERSGPPMDHRVYQLSSTSAVFEKARSMLANARQVVIFDGFPRAAELLVSELAEVAGRGVQVGTHLYDEPAAGLRSSEHLDVVIDPRGRLTLERWPGHWLALVVDAREMLLAFFDADLKGVHQAVWSRSPYLVWVFHSASSAELVLCAVESQIQEGSSVEQIRSTLADLQPLRAHQSDAYHDLRDMLDPRSDSDPSVVDPVSENDPKPLKEPSA